MPWKKVIPLWKQLGVIDPLVDAGERAAVEGIGDFGKKVGWRLRIL